MLQLENVSCGYGALRAVHDLSLQVGKGQITALLGPNGAGKSSTLMCIAGHVTLQTGRITLGDIDISHMPVRERVRAGLAIAPEGRRLFPDLTVEENLMVGGVTQPRARFQADRDVVLDAFPRLGERLDQPAGRLSGGEQQMLAIGRALMARPSVIVIDELSLGLMPKVIDDCYATLVRLVRDEGLGVLLVEQNTSRALAVSDHVYVLASGRMVWQGDGVEARKNSEEVERAVLGAAA